MSSREQILGRLKGASWVSGLIPPAAIAPSPPQAGDIELFITKAQAAAAQVERASDLGAAREIIANYIKEHGITRVIGAQDQATIGMELRKLANEAGINYYTSADLKGSRYREYVLQAELGISGCSYAVAETGTLVIAHNHSNERLVSHAPDHYIGIVYAEQILADRFCLASILQEDPSPPSAWTLITGVSRTADVALQVVLGMHGPRKVTVIIIG